MLRQALLFTLIVAAAPVAAEDAGNFMIGGDAYLAGRSVEVSDPIDADLFAAGNRVSVEAEIGGTAHLVGRNIEVDDRIGGNLYAAGMDVEVDGPVSGNVTAMGNSVTISEAVSGNIRAMGGDVELSAPVAGSAVLAGETVVLDAEVLGDLALTAATIDWGDDARISGTLYLYGDDPDAVDVPERVIPADRIEFRAVEHWEHDYGNGFEDSAKPGFWSGVGSFFGGVILTGIFATLMAALAPQFTQTLREGALASPLRSLWIGALGLAAAIGSTVVLAMTGIGILLAPLSIALAVFLGFAGYVIGAYLLGVWAMDAVGQGLPETTGDRAVAAFVGATLLGLVMLVPFIGWLAAFAVLLIGVGGVMIRFFAPGFYTNAA